MDSNQPDRKALIAMSTTIIARCQDGISRHAEFEDRSLAEAWAEWGHACTRQHTFTELEATLPAGSSRFQYYIDGGAPLSALDCAYRLEASGFSPDDCDAAMAAVRYAYNRKASAS